MAVHSNDVCLKMFSVYQLHSLITSFMTPYYIHTHAHTHTHTHTNTQTHTHRTTYWSGLHGRCWACLPSLLGIWLLHGRSGDSRLWHSPGPFGPKAEVPRSWSSVNLYHTRKVRSDSRRILILTLPLLYWQRWSSYSTYLASDGLVTHTLIHEKKCPIISISLNCLSDTPPVHSSLLLTDCSSSSASRSDRIYFFIFLPTYPAPIHTLIHSTISMSLFTGGGTNQKRRLANYPCHPLVVMPAILATWYRTTPPTLSCPVLTLPYPILNYSILSCPILPYLKLFYPTLSQPRTVI